MLTLPCVCTMPFHSFLKKKRKNRNKNKNKKSKSSKSSGRTKSGKASTTKSGKASTTPKPTPKPTPMTTEEATMSQSPTMSPTRSHEDKLYDFNDGVFPPDEKWATGGDIGGAWFATEMQSNGVIRSPALYGPTSTYSNATLYISDGFGGGVVTFDILASVFQPHDRFNLCVDGVCDLDYISGNQWVNRALGVGAGSHRIDFMYDWNPFTVPVISLPDRVPGVEGKDLYALYFYLQVRSIISLCFRFLLNNQGVVYIDNVFVNELVAPEQS